MMPNGGTFGGYHTYDDFGMIPKSKIIFAPPKPKFNIVAVPYADGELDYTDVLTGSVPYENRKGTVEFILLTGDDYQDKYSQLLQFFHGQKMNVILDDDTNYYYTGRFSVNEWKSWEGKSSIAIDYNLDPYKYAVSSSISHDWLWSDLFNTTIYYGHFYVDGTMSRNLINPSNNTLTPAFTCSSAMSVVKDGVTYQLPAGTSRNHGMTLTTGDNNMVFTGNGTVYVDYSLDKIL